MARVLGIEGDYVPSELRTALVDGLRVYDEAIVLPGAHRSQESGGFKNVVMRIAGHERELRADIFSPNWFSGVSMVPFPNDVAERLLTDPDRRQRALAALVKAIPSEMASAELQVGPELDGEPSGADAADWQFGFDSPGCCVGLYSAQETRAPRVGLEGMDRVHSKYYLVCKAGGGIAAQTFHARFLAAMAKGASLDEALEQGNSPGPQALRRVATAAKRNRGRILIAAAHALGFHSIDTISDQASPDGAAMRVAITPIDVACNVLRKVDTSSRSVWQYTSGCVDAASSLGLVSSSNVAMGFVLFTGTNGEFKINLKNSFHDSLPFGTPRLCSNREAVTAAAECHKAHRTRPDTTATGPHPDSAWLRERFGWVDRGLGVDVEPPALWGTFASEEWLASWARELGVAQLRTVRLAPEVVALAGVEGAKLRAAARHVQGSTHSTR